MSKMSILKVYYVLRVLLGIIFIWASWQKILDPEAFSRIVANYRLLPAIFVPPVSLFLPWLEAACGLMLVSGYLVRGSLLIVDSLLVVFLLIFVINIFRGVDISCGCFSLSLQAGKSALPYLLRDSLFLLVGAWLFFYKARKDQLQT